MNKERRIRVEYVSDWPGTGEDNVEGGGSSGIVSSHVHLLVPVNSLSLSVSPFERHRSPFSKTCLNPSIHHAELVFSV